MLIVLVWKFSPFAMTGSAREAKTCNTAEGSSRAERITSSPLLMRDRIKAWRREGTFKPNVKAVGDTLQRFAMVALDADRTASGFLSHKTDMALRRVRGVLVSVRLLMAERGTGRKLCLGSPFGRRKGQSDGLRLRRQFAMRKGFGPLKLLNGFRIVRSREGPQVRKLVDRLNWEGEV